MLEPQSRTLLLDALKPPPEYRLDFAVGTTFTLDLVAMLVAPLAFALLDRSAPDGKLIADPLALLEALRRNAGRFAVFCQAGRICVPKPDRLLLSYLEGNVIEVEAPYEGVFHPKVWVIRFVADDKPVFYRFVCASRNLTFDRSWDTALVLDGKLVERKNAYAANHPLGDFLLALPSLAVRGEVASGIKERIEQLQEEVRKVDFEIPDGFEAYGFMPLGIDGYRASPFKGRIDRMLVVSPFVCPKGLRTLMNAANAGIQLVARLDELQKLDPEDLKGIEPVQVFSDEHTEEEPVADAAEESFDGGTDPELSGLHAKLYIADGGWNSRLWTGSANATAAAFQRNVEFLVELHGKKSLCGISALLSEGAGQTGFASFLKPYVPAPPPPEVEAKRKVEETLDAVRLALGTLPMRWRVSEEQGGWRMELMLVGKPPALPDGIELRAWPITCKPEAFSRPLNWKAEPAVAFAPMTFEALTTFVAFEVSLPGQTLVGPIQFALNLPAEGFPQDRAKRLLLKFLDSSDAILRYVHLLLEQSSFPKTGELPAFGTMGAGNGSWGNGQLGEALLEPLIRVLRQDPSRLDDVARLVADLREAGVKNTQLPAGFEEIWEPIWEARKRLNREKTPS